MKHKADGLYYFDSDMFDKQYACTIGRHVFWGAFPSGKVLITLNNVRKALKLGVNINWAAGAMEAESKVTPNEYFSFSDAYYDSNTTADKARAFMELLTERACREGLLA